jgi:hypothetical protein
LVEAIVAIPVLNIFEQIRVVDLKGRADEEGSSTSEDGTARSCNVRGVGLGVPVTESGVVD